jgi:hypothetical protein
VHLVGFTMEIYNLVFGVPQWHRILLYSEK